MRRGTRRWGLFMIALLSACGGGGGSGASTNVDLGSLSVSTGALAPAFSPSLTSYTVGPAPLNPTVTVTATTADPAATLTLDGLPLASGAPSAPIALPAGDTRVMLRVLAADGTTSKTTTIVFRRAGAELASLTVSTGTLSPSFERSLTAYHVGPGLLDATVVIRATPEEPASTLRIQGLPTASGAPSAPIPLITGLTTVTVVVTAADGVTSRTVTIVFERGFPAAQEAYLKASNNRLMDYLDASSTRYSGGMEFGEQVAVSGDTLVVGARLEDGGSAGVDGDQSNTSAGGSGAVYVFVRSGGTWTQQAYLKASNTGANDDFGASVAIDGDTIVVGAPNEDGSATGVNGNQGSDASSSSGAAYVFVRNGGSWTQQAYLKASNTEAADQFGRDVAISADTIAVGAPGEDSGATGVDGNQGSNSANGSGAAYVFVRTAGAWTQQAYLKASNAEASDTFGWSLALSGESLVVGAYNEGSGAVGVGGNQADNSVPGAGAVYVFVRSGSSWSQQAYLKPSNTRLNGAFSFGHSVGLTGDTLVVGANRESSAGTGVNGSQAPGAVVGAAYVFARAGTTWGQQAYLKPPPLGADTGGFGNCVAAGPDTVVVGHPGEPGSAAGVNAPDTCNTPGGACKSHSGAAYVYLRDGGTTWSQGARLKASNPDVVDQFGGLAGGAVALWRDTVLVGAKHEASNATGVGGNQANNSLTFAGAAYVFR